MRVTPQGDEVGLSVVIPCFNEEAGIDELVRRVTAACSARFANDYEIILVNDGSRDATWQCIARHARLSAHVIGMDLARNYGHQLALTAGLRMSRGRLIFILDADLQDPPELLGAMLDVLGQGHDVVYGHRIVRHGESRFKRWTAALFYRGIGAMTDVPLPRDTGDFRLMTRRVLDHLNAMPERYRFVRGMVSWIGHSQVAFPYERDPRFAGSTHYPLRKMVAFALDAVTSFSVVPLRFASMLGLLFGIAGFLALSWVVFAFLKGETVPGWTSLSALVLIMGSAQLMMLGIFGEYLGRMYMEAKQRPPYLVRDIVEMDADRSASPVHDMEKTLQQRLAAGGQ